MKLARIIKRAYQNNGIDFPGARFILEHKQELKNLFLRYVKKSLFFAGLGLKINCVFFDDLALHYSRLAQYASDIDLFIYKNRLGRE